MSAAGGAGRNMAAREMTEDGSAMRNGAAARTILVRDASCVEALGRTAGSSECASSVSGKSAAARSWGCSRNLCRRQGFLESMGSAYGRERIDARCGGLGAGAVGEEGEGGTACGAMGLAGFVLL